MIRLLKLDAQGFELRILDGAKELLKSKAVKMIKLEVAKKWLWAQGFTPVQFCEKLMSFGFVLWYYGIDENGKGETIDASRCRALALANTIYELVAKI